MAGKPDDAPKRFYKSSQAAPLEGGFGVMLDSRALRTPKGARLVLPTEALAELIAREWAAQGDKINLGGMAATRLAFTAADAIAAARAETCAEVVRYAGADLLCYFAEAPQTLVARQDQLWAPLLDWADKALGVRLVRVAGIRHQPQPEASLARLAQIAVAADDFGLAGLAYGVGLYGSAILALAVREGEIGSEAAFDVSRLDEAFQEEQWGVDPEAAARTANRRADAILLGQWFRALEV
jgi:chaperone required for assembly of F1-ATPase